MPSLNPRALRTVKGPRLDITARAPRGALRKPIPQEVGPVIIDGKVLTGPEARLVRALQRLKIPYVAQVEVGGGRRLGGGILDVWLPAHRLVLEYQGPFHNTLEGRTRDFLRAATRQKFGAVDIIPIYDRDMQHIEEKLLQITRRG